MCLNFFLRDEVRPTKYFADSSKVFIDFIYYKLKVIWPYQQLIQVKALVVAYLLATDSLAQFNFV